MNDREPSASAPWPGLARRNLLPALLALLMLLPGLSAGADKAKAKTDLCVPETEVAEPLPLTPEERMEQFDERLGVIHQDVGSMLDRVDDNARMVEEHGGRLETGEGRMDEMSRQLGGTAARVEQNQHLLDRHESRIQDNSVKLYEVRMDLDQTRQSIDELEQRLQRLIWTKPKRPGADDAGQLAGAGSGMLPFALGLLLPAGILLFQAARIGPLPLAAGSAGVLLALAGAALGFALFGLGIRYGDSIAGLLGSPFQFLPSLVEWSPAPGLPEIAKTLMSRLPIVVGAALLICTTAGSRLTPVGGFVAALLAGALLLPLFGHWAEAGWLFGLGFEPAGGVVEIALVGGSAALGLAIGLRVREEGGGGSDSILLLPAVGLIWVGWLEPLLLRPAPGSALALVLGGWITATAAVLAKALVSALFDAQSRRLQGLPTAFLAGVLVVPAVGPDASVVEMTALGLLVGGLHGLLSGWLLNRRGPAADLALTFVLAGLAAALTSALVGPKGLLHMPVAEGLPIQLLGAAVAILLGGGLGLLLGWLLRIAPGMLRRRGEAEPA